MTLVYYYIQDIMFTIEIQGQIFNLQLLYVLNTNQIINNIFQNDKYIKYSQTNMKSIVRGGIDD